ncbi:hypothetical protein CEY12_06170 [Chryseobacterium sp. T16E-39]|uniref:hypothetical protein n=1 Tax=Chryseobacterium sp. T16E-39 TaxID=2015076 RepID=UPI000B5B1897|nr:hypothetical protein [Chryseobacterium sp. T16E-39]ASK29714.1 hypothetical protein CEY12_06170 [Chryseobacterium sp. T16E-39]
MQISGEIKEVLHDRIKLITSQKKQQIDVFYTARNEPFVKKLVTRERVEFNIVFESVEVQGTFLAKVWLYDIIHPRPPLPPSRKKGDGVGTWRDPNAK